MQRTFVVSVGVLVGLFAWLTGRGFLSPLFLLGAAVVLLGWRFMSAGGKPPVPAGFDASFWNKNIALDTTTGALWVRDKSGITATLQREEVVGWEMQNSNFSSQAVVGPRVTPMDNRLLIKTKNLQRPVWTVPFNAHTSLTGGGNHANHRELKDWYERLNAFYNYSAQPLQARSAVSGV